jgi:uncharacterized membrane protein
MRPAHNFFLLSVTLEFSYQYIYYSTIYTVLKKVHYNGIFLMFYIKNLPLSISVDSSLNVLGMPNDI